MKHFAVILILFCCSCSLFAQGEIDEQQKIFYRNERTFAFLLNSNGIGTNFRYAKRIDGFRKTLYEIEFNYLKHPKETKITFDRTNRSIIYGKLNAAFNLKGAIGFQKEFFQKRDLGGISIRYFVNGGPAFVFLKPVYYEYGIPNSYDTYYDKFMQHGDYIGRAPFTMGFSELSLSPGIYGKFGFTFEYSRIDAVFHALGVGCGLDAYARRLDIMATPPEKILFVLPDDYFVFTLFISYRFGKVIDTQFSPRRNKLDEMLVD